MHGTRERPAAADYEIVVVDALRKPWPRAEAPVALGVPVRIAARRKRERRHFTAGLRRPAREARN